jgi:hypothetical protein
VQTLEQRVDRLERSSRRWRLGFFAAVGGAAILGATTTKPAPPDAAFANLTATHLSIKNPAGGPEFSVVANGSQTFLQIGSLASSAIIVVDKDGANVLMNHSSPKGVTFATLGVDDTSGSVGLRDASAKTKELEP